MSVVKRIINARIITALLSTVTDNIIQLSSSRSFVCFQAVVFIREKMHAKYVSY